MSMIRKMTPVAIAIAALCSAPAFASGATATAGTGQATMWTGSSNDDTTNNATLKNHVLENATGNIGVNNAAGSGNQQANTTSVAKSSQGDASAAVGAGQIKAGSFVMNVDDVKNNATLQDDVLENASGNIGVNNASGTNNQQANGTAIAVSSGENGSASASVNAGQGGLSWAWSFNNTTNNATLKDDVLQNASGNVGVNNAAGDNNQQSNGLALATGDDGNASAKISAGQLDVWTMSLSAGKVTNNATLRDDVLENAKGNVGVSNAAGENNQQGNNLAVAVTDQGLASASAQSTQVSLLTGSGTNEGVTNNATVQNDVLRNATGNIGVNNTAGTNNQQLNSLSLATSTTTSEY